jgi:hypothetical protein
VVRGGVAPALLPVLASLGGHFGGVESLILNRLFSVGADFEQVRHFWPAAAQALISFGGP